MPNLLNDSSTKENIPLVQHSHLSRSDHFHRLFEENPRASVSSFYSTQPGMVLVADLDKSAFRDILAKPVAGGSKKPRA